MPIRPDDPGTRAVQWATFRPLYIDGTIAAKARVLLLGKKPAAA
jgi:hypothetical protein